MFDGGLEIPSHPPTPPPPQTFSPRIYIDLKNDPGAHEIRGFPRIREKSAALD